MLHAGADEDGEDIAVAQDVVRAASDDNAGAFGGEMSQVVRIARCLDEQGEEVLLSLPELEMEYRNNGKTRHTEEVGQSDEWYYVI